MNFYLMHIYLNRCVFILYFVCLLLFTLIVFPHSSKIHMQQRLDYNIFNACSNKLRRNNKLLSYRFLIAWMNLIQRKFHPMHKIHNVFM